MNAVKTIAIDERRYKVFQLKRIGMSNREIADHLTDQGIAVSHTTVGKDWHKVLKEAAVGRGDEVNEMQELQHARYEALIESLWATATGRKLSESEKGMPDPRAVDSILRAIKGIRELFGLDRAVGTLDNPLTLNLPPAPPEDDLTLDLEGLSRDELERLHDIFGAIIEAQNVVAGNA